MTISFEPSCSCRTYTEYYYTGKISSKKTFKIEDKKEYIDGEDISYFPNGIIKEFKIWKNSFPEGRAYCNFDNGKLEHEEFYINKFKSGVWKYYDKDGLLVKEIVFEKNKTTWDSKNNLAVERYYRNGKILIERKLSGTKDEKVITIKKDTLLTGRQLFQVNCSSCHELINEKNAPALAGISHIRKKDWLLQMIKDANFLLQLEDKQAKNLYLKWNMQSHPTFRKLSNEEIESILEYLK
jgi:antitoxin component YwqK of YwqJK toxin-antitoxin module